MERTLGLDPGERERWRRGRARYAVWVARVQDRAVLRRLAQVGEQLTQALGGSFVPMAPAQAHITLFVAGFPAQQPALDDDVSYATLEAQAAAVARLRGGPLRVHVGGASGFLSCPLLEVVDGRGDLVRLRAALGAGASEVRFAPYLPHVTVGSLPESVPTDAVREALEPLRRLPPLRLRVDQVELVSFDAAVAGSPLVTEVAVPLSGRSRARASRR